MSGSDEADKMAFVFPGVGVAPCGHEADFLARHRSIMTPFLEEASESAEADLTAAVAHESTADLGAREQEIFAHAFGCACSAVYRQHDILPSYMAGHSLGIYSAMAAAEAMSFPDALRTVVRAHELARDTCGDGQFAMGVTVGLTAEEIEAILARQNHASIRLVNFNNPASHVLSGYRCEMEMFLREAESAGALKANFLAVATPYHNPIFLAGASHELELFLKDLPSWRRPICPIISPFDQSELTSTGQLIGALAANLSNPVYWQRTIKALSALGVKAVYECGAGISLTQNARFIPNAPKHFNVKTSARRLSN